MLFKYCKRLYYIFAFVMTYMETKNHWKGNLFKILCSHHIVWICPQSSSTNTCTSKHFISQPIAYLISI